MKKIGDFFSVLLGAAYLIFMAGSFIYGLITKESGWTLLGAVLLVVLLYSMWHERGSKKPAKKPKSKPKPQIARAMTAREMQDSAREYLRWRRDVELEDLQYHRKGRSGEETKAGWFYSHHQYPGDYMGKKTSAADYVRWSKEVERQEIGLMGHLPRK